MHSATELILARMESNPEEFVMGTSRWSNILNKLSEFAQKDEWKVVLARWNEIRMDQLHRHIMQELCAPDEPKQTAFDFINSRSSNLITTLEMKQQVLDLLQKEVDQV